MKLYDCSTAPSPRRVRIFLAEKGVAVPTVQVNLRDGPGYSLVDITTQITVEFAKWAKLPIPESCPHLARWFATVSARPSAKA